MTKSPPPFAPRFCAVVVAAGKGLRAGGGVPKQFAKWRGQPLVRHSVERLLTAGAAPLVVAVPDSHRAEAEAALAGLGPLVLVSGGDTRQASVRAALEHLANMDVTQPVLIHDAARPDLPATVIEALVAALDTAPGAIPVLPVVDSVVRGRDGLREAAVPREGLYRVQTPQAFRFDAILAAHRDWIDAGEAGDDATVAEAAGLAIALVSGDERLRKVTFASDFEDVAMNCRTGLGFDVHRLVDGEDLWLCGVQIDHPRGLSGHSDADVAIHALVDALLGAIAAGDIGDHFPPSDPQWKGAASDRFLAHAAMLVRQSGHAIANVDVTIICEAPKIGPHKAAMRARLAQILGIDIGMVSVKATTTERLGLTGRGEGIAAQAIATVLALEVVGASRARHMKDTRSMDNLLPPEMVGLAARVIAANRAIGRTVALAESCTGGLVAAALTEIAGSSAVLDRGFVTYSNAAKIEMLGVSEDLIDTFGAVSVAVAWAMAKGALEHSRADIAVAITGIAGPEGGSEQKPVGTVVFAVARRGADPEAAEAETQLFAEARDRAEVRRQAALVALELLLPSPSVP